MTNIEPNDSPSPILISDEEVAIEFAYRWFSQGKSEAIKYIDTSCSERIVRHLIRNLRGRPNRESEALSITNWSLWLLTCQLEHFLTSDTPIRSPIALYFGIARLSLTRFLSESYSNDIEVLMTDLLKSSDRSYFELIAQFEAKPRSQQIREREAIIKLHRIGRLQQDILDVIFRIPSIWDSPHRNKKIAIELRKRGIEASSRSSA